jgi:hypothetical protein
VKEIECVTLNLSDFIIYIIITDDRNDKNYYGIVLKIYLNGSNPTSLNVSHAIVSRNSINTFVIKIIHK